jgi:predicted nucleic acid-binding protein
MKKLKIYLDTSVINLLFADDAPEYKSITEEFFNNYLDKYEVYISEIVYAEINRTKNEKRKEMLLNVISKYRIDVYASINNEIESMANSYISAGIIPQNKLDDAFHVAFCTYYNIDILLSWNFKHLANINKQLKINAFNKSWVI